MGRKDYKEYKGSVDCKDSMAIIDSIDIKYFTNYRLN